MAEQDGGWFEVRGFLNLESRFSRMPRASRVIA